MTLDQAIVAYKQFYGEKSYNDNNYFRDHNIVPDTYMTRLANRVKKIHDKHPDVFSNKRILDIGANNGDQSFILDRMGNVVTSFDINDFILMFLEDNLPDGDIVNTIDKVKEKSYDTVFCSSVINLQAKPYEWFESLFDIDFKTLVLIYHDGYTHPINQTAKQYSPDGLSGNSSLVEKSALLEVCNRLGLNVIDSDLTWQDNVAIDGIEYKQTALVVEKT